MREKTLREKVIEGGFWVFSIRICSRIFRFIRTIILARVLAPHDFGLFGIALLTVSILETFSETGFLAALIQKKKDIKPYLNTAWTIWVLRGFGLFSILFLIAPYAASFFNAPEAKPVIQVIALSILLQAFTNIGVIYFRKELEFNKQFLYQIGGAIADFVVSISAAFLLKNVWAIVFGLLAGKIVSLILSYLIHPYRPSFNLDLKKASELFDFGKWVLGSNILIFLITQGDDILVGKLLGTLALGFYQMAYRISNMPTTEITHIISQVTFPAYSKLQDDILKLKKAYLKVLQITAFLSFPMAGLIFILAPDFTKIVLGEKWMTMVPAMQVLVLWGLLRSIGATTGPIFQAVGKPELITKLNVLKLFLLAILIYPFSVKWNILGTSLAVFLAALIVNPLASLLAIRVIRCSVAEFAKLILLPMIGTLAMITPIVVFKHLVSASSQLSFFIAFICTALVVYLGLAYLFDLVFAYNIRAFKGQLTTSKEG